MTDLFNSGELEKIVSAKLTILMSDYYEFEKLIKSMSGQVRGELDIVREDMKSINLALNSIPSQFDEDFSKKMNRILDVALEIEVHSKKLNASLEKDLSSALEGKVLAITDRINLEIKGFSLTSKSQLFLYGGLSAVVGGILGGIITWVFIPMFFA